MNELIVFNNPVFGDIRTISIDGEPWFVGKDVATVLGYKDTVNALKAHVDDEDKRGGWQITTPSGEQQMTIINESGLYSLILSSKLRTAKEFKRWVTSEVLPSLRKTGSYQMPMMTAEQRIAAALIDATKLLNERTAQVEALTAENALLRPDAEYANECLQAENCIKTLVIAKELGMSAERLNEILRLLNVQYKRGNQWFLKSKYQDKGYTDVQTIVLHNRDGTTKVATTTVWTQQGKRFIIELLKKYGYIDHKRLTEKATGTKCRKSNVPYFNGERLRKQMDVRGVSMNGLSRMTGISRNTLVKYRDGKVWPTRERRNWICTALGVSNTYFDY